MDSVPPRPRRPDGSELGELALRWWAAWSDMPQVSVFTEAEWERLADTARLVDKYERTEDFQTRLELFREITRREEEELGWTGPAYRKPSEP